MSHRHSQIVAVVGTVWVCLACVNGAAASASTFGITLRGALSPYAPAARNATLSLHVTVNDAAGEPEPMVGVAIVLPQGMEIHDLSSFSMACPLSILMRTAAACPAESKIGRGSIEWALPFGEDAKEHGTVSVYKGLTAARSVVLVLEVSAPAPIASTVEAVSGPLNSGFDKELEIGFPLIPAVPRGPAISTTRLDLTFGARVPRSTEPGTRLQPGAVRVPRRCPRRGFRFAARLSFLGGQTVQTSATVACPRIP